MIEECKQQCLPSSLTQERIPAVQLLFGGCSRISCFISLLPFLSIFSLCPKKLYLVWPREGSRDCWRSIPATAPGLCLFLHVKLERKCRQWCYLTSMAPKYILEVSPPFRRCLCIFHLFPTCPFKLWFFCSQVSLGWCSLETQGLLKKQASRVPVPCFHLHYQSGGII